MKRLSFQVSQESSKHKTEKKNNQKKPKLTVSGFSLNSHKMDLLPNEPNVKNMMSPFLFFLNLISKI